MTDAVETSSADEEDEEDPRWLDKAIDVILELLDLL